MRKILLTTAVKQRGYYDYWGANTPKTMLRLAWKRRASYGLRFLKYNIPEIDVLEFPSWKQFRDKIRKGNYDVVGFSFYLDEIPRIIKMAKFARENGVKELWSGNYGTLTPEVGKHFDRLFRGYAEEELAKELGVNIGSLKHPPIIVHSGMPFGLQFIKLGVLQTTRGCPMGCKFCQTPEFSPEAEAVPLESIEEVLLEYKRLGVREVLIIDENFGILRRHAENVIDLLDKHGLFWSPMTRADVIEPNLDRWVSKGLTGALIGIESFSQHNLDFMEKKESSGRIKRLIAEMNKRNLFIIGYYIIGFEGDTTESVKRDILELKELNLDMYQVCVLTPLPGTPLWGHIDRKYGISKTEYSRFDTKHLVWNHPNIGPEEMEGLMARCFETVYSPRTFFRTLVKFYLKYTSHGFWKGMGYIMRSIMDANVSYHIKREYRPLGVR